MHYEILVNGRFVDPLRIKLPRGRVLDGPMLASFEQERDRLDSMIARNSRVASTGQAAALTSNTFLFGDDRRCAARCGDPATSCARVLDAGTACPFDMDCAVVEQPPED